MKFKPRKFLRNFGRSLIEPLSVPRIALIVLTVPLQEAIASHLEMATFSWPRTSMNILIFTAVLHAASIYTRRISARSSQRRSW